MGFHSFRSHWMEFKYQRFTSCVSGICRKLPESKLTTTELADIESLSSGSYTPSPVTSINGQDVSYLTELGSGMQDLDALYNSVVYSPATAGSNDGLGFFARANFRQHSDTNALTFENGTSIVVSATAESLSAIPSSGDILYNLLTNGSLSTPASTPTNASSPPSLPLGPTYPSPIAKHSGNIISTYFMNETENADVAVVNVASFDAQGFDSIFEFLNISSSFLALCASAGKKRLIIDVRNNPGGTVALGYFLFQQLFPDAIPYSGIRLRDSDAANKLGQIASANLVQNRTDITLEALPFNAQNLLQSPNGSNITSWQQFYGPVQEHDDTFSNIASWQFSSTIYNNQQLTPIYNGTAIPPQVFAGEAITLVSPNPHLHAAQKRAPLNSSYS